MAVNLSVNKKKTEFEKQLIIISMLAFRFVSSLISELG